MKNTRLFILLFILIPYQFCLANTSQPPIDSIKAKIVGTHLFSLQWISWDYFGQVEIKEQNGELTINGEQRGKGDQSGDYLTIDGTLEIVDYKNLKFNGEITTRVSYINAGKPCVRKGNFTFRASGKRKYWRLQQMLNPCDQTSTDYVDIFWKKISNSSSSLNSKSKVEQKKAALEPQIDAIFKAWNSKEKPGGAIGIFKEGKLIFSKAYGMASLEYDIQNEVSTVFNIASVSKQFTAFSLILLEQQGKLSLDDDIRKYLPEVPDFGHTITIKHLLHHTSGLRNFQNILAMAGWREGESMTNEDLLKFISKQKELNFTPGDEYLYCNSGFNLSTAIVERLTGKTFQNWTKENIFDPLGMTNSGYREDMEKIHKNTATSYDGDQANGFKQPLKYWTYMGNGNVYTTIADLVKWLDNFRSPKVGGKAGIDQLVERGVLNNGDTLSYALGIGVGTYKGLKVYRHGGSVGGYRSNMMYFPDQETGVMVLSNFSIANPGQKAAAVVDLVLKDQLQPSSTNQNNSSEISRTPVKIAPATFEPYLGQYFVEGVVVELSQKEGTMFIYAEGTLPSPLAVQASSDTTFFVEGTDLGFRIYNPTTENTRRIFVTFQGDGYWGFQIADQNFREELIGTYYSSELDTRYNILEKEGELIVQHTRHTDFKLIPKSRNQLYGTAYFFSDVKVERDENEKIKGLRVSNGRVRNLWFEKL